MAMLEITGPASEGERHLAIALFQLCDRLEAQERTQGPEEALFRNLRMHAEKALIEAGYSPDDVRRYTGTKTCEANCLCNRHWNYPRQRP